MLLMVIRAEIMLSILLFLLNHILEFVGAYVGINIGTGVSNMPSALDVVAILKANQITHVRLYDAVILVEGT